LIVRERPIILRDRYNERELAGKELIDSEKERPILLRDRYNERELAGKEKKN
jgi:hypothetical protein